MEEPAGLENVRHSGPVLLTPVVASLTSPTSSLAHRTGLELGVPGQTCPKNGQYMNGWRFLAHRLPKIICRRYKGPTQAVSSQSEGQAWGWMILEHRTSC
jgi:hypothetical protein